jgi:hypothetical protein
MGLRGSWEYAVAGADSNTDTCCHHVELNTDHHHSHSALTQNTSTSKCCTLKQKIPMQLGKATAKSIHG